jgi:hypothetical protein
MFRKDYSMRLTQHRKDHAPPLKVATGATGAAAMLDMSPDHFTRYVAPDLRVARVGRRKLYLVSEITRWAEQNAARTLDG